MRKVDNFDLIKEHLSFNNKDEFYVVQILQRKKDGNASLHVRHGYRLLKTYCIYSVQSLNDLHDRIVELCEDNNARAYINMNVRNASEVALECIKRYASLVNDGNSHMGGNVYEKVCGNTKARGYKALWVVDIDEPDKVDLIINLIMSCRRNPDFTLYKIPTVNGFHLICHGFDTKQFDLLLRDNNLGKIDIHKNNPTLLYYNDISSKPKQDSIQSREV